MTRFIAVCVLGSALLVYVGIGIIDQKKDLQITIAQHEDTIVEQQAQLQYLKALNGTAEEEIVTLSNTNEVKTEGLRLKGMDHKATRKDLSMCLAILKAKGW